MPGRRRAALGIGSRHGPERFGVGLGGVSEIAGDPAERVETIDGDGVEGGAEGGLFGGGEAAIRGFDAEDGALAEVGVGQAEVGGVADAVQFQGALLGGEAPPDFIAAADSTADAAHEPESSFLVAPGGMIGGDESAATPSS